MESCYVASNREISTAEQFESKCQICRRVQGCYEENLLNVLATRGFNLRILNVFSALDEALH